MACRDSRTEITVDSGAMVTTETFLVGISIGSVKWVSLGTEMAVAKIFDDSLVVRDSSVCYCMMSLSVMLLIR